MKLTCIARAGRENVICRDGRFATNEPRDGHSLCAFSAIMVYYGGICVSSFTTCFIVLMLVKVVFGSSYAKSTSDQRNVKIAVYVICFGVGFIPCLHAVINQNIVSREGGYCFVGSTEDVLDNTLKYITPLVLTMSINSISLVILIAYITRNLRMRTKKQTLKVHCCLLARSPQQHPSSDAG